MLLLADLLIFLAVFLLVGAAGRLADFHYDYVMVADVLAERRRTALERAPLRRAMDPVVLALAGLVRRLGPVGLRARTQQNLMHAGNPWGYTAEEYIGWALTVALLAGFTMALLLLGSGHFNILFVIVVAVVAYVGTMSSLKGRGERRRLAFERQLPYFLDLTSLSMGAGATFLKSCESAIMRSTKGPLEDEVEIMLGEVHAGTPTAQALTNMTKRMESAELAQMVQAVKQGDELGTPLVRVFEQQAELNRYRRSTHGERLAAKLPNRLAVPTVFLMLAVFILLFGPIIVRALRGGLV